MRILALDPGTSCGFAVSGGPSGTWNLAPKRGESPGMRYIRLGNLLEAVHMEHAFGLVAFEKSFQRGQAAREVHLKLVGAIETFCARHDIDLTHVYAATLKKWATGRGHASKAEMRARLYVRTGVGDPRLPCQPSEDEIDALWILAWAQEHYGRAA